MNAARLAADRAFMAHMQQQKARVVVLLASLAAIAALHVLPFA